jgi:hypothetical protein
VEGGRAKVEWMQSTRPKQSRKWLHVKFVLSLLAERF